MGHPFLGPRGSLAWIAPLAHPPSRAPVAPREFRHIVPPVVRSAPRQFPHYKHSEWHGKVGYVRLSQTIGAAWHDLKAVCARHAGCGRSRSCRSARPLGELWAWLDYMHDDTCITKAHHCAYQPSFEVRCRARAAFKALPDVAEFLAAEAVLPNVDEPC